MKLKTLIQLSRTLAGTLVLLGAGSIYPIANSHASSTAAVLPQRRTDATVETVRFQSALIGRTLPYNVVLPPDYRASRNTRYPVLYLLHGLQGHHSDWLTRTNVADYASKYRMIVVMPEGNDGWYTDSGTVPSDKYESYFINELIPDVQKRYRTIESRYGRGVAGLSMGGYGALKFGLKYPATFAFAGSMSGALDAASWLDKDLIPKSIRDSVTQVFGADGSETHQANDLFALARAMSNARVPTLPYIYFDCGNEDPVCGSNPAFAALLREKKIAHEYRQLPGSHGWPYWDQQVQEVLKIAAEKMRGVRSAK